MLGSEISQAVVKVQQGHDDTRNGLIQQYLPFILKVASKTCKRFVRLGVDDEVSVALIAFNEALDKYDVSKNSSFFTFAEAVIKRRMIDYFRKNKQERQELPLSSVLPGEDEQELNSPLEILTWGKAHTIHFEEEIATLRREEILEYQSILKSYGITFQELLECSPKHHDARVTAYQVAKRIYDNEGYRRYLQNKKALPLKELSEEVNVSRKTLERQRKYIIALTIVLMSGFYFLEDYLEGLKG